MHTPALLVETSALACPNNAIIAATLRTTATNACMYHAAAASSCKGDGKRSMSSKTSKVLFEKGLTIEVI